MTGYAAAIWRRRWFWSSLALYDLQKRYRHTLLGALWIYVHPLCTALLMTVALHRLFDVSLRDHLPAVLAGLCFWNYFANVCLQGGGSIFWSETYLRHHPAPVAIYPLRVALTCFLLLTLVLGATMLLAWLWRGAPSLAATLSLAPTLVLLLAFGWAVATIAGVANVYVPDVQHVLEVGLPMLFYVSPVLYTRTMAESKGMAWLTAMNPLAAFIDLVRAPIAEGAAPALASYATAAGLVAGTGVVAALLLRRCEKHIILAIQS